MEGPRVLRTLALNILLVVSGLSGRIAWAATPTTGDLIDQLVEIDAPTAGLHPTLMGATFLGDGAPEVFQGGIIGSQSPKRFPQMVELVRRGIDALPDLLEHLSDRRETKLVVGNTAPFTPFMFQEFSDAYDPRTRAESRRGAIASASQPDDKEGAIRRGTQHSFNGRYTVKVGDVCYALIGQIVNRRLFAVRYQPTGGLVVSSPLESPILIADIKKDWGHIDTEELKASFLLDAQSSSAYFYEPALQHLKFYFPREYQKQSSTVEFAAKIRAMTNRSNGLDPR